MATSAEATGSQIVVESTEPTRQPPPRHIGIPIGKRPSPDMGACLVFSAELARQDILRRQQCSSVLRLVSGGFDGRSLCSSWPDTPVHGDQGPQLISSNACLGRDSNAPVSGGKYYADSDQGILEMYQDLAASPVFSWAIIATSREKSDPTSIPTPRLA